MLAFCRSCGEEEEEEEGGDEGEDAPSLQEQEIEKMRLLFNQGRLAERGASELVLSQVLNSYPTTKLRIWIFPRVIFGYFVPKNSFSTLSFFSGKCVKIGDKSLDSLSQNPIQVSSCNGIAGDMMEKTLTLGIALLRGGNIDVQVNLRRALIQLNNKITSNNYSGLCNTSLYLWT